MEVGRDRKICAFKDCCSVEIGVLDSAIDPRGGKGSVRLV